MAKNIPFFEMFAELQTSAGLRLRLAGAQVKHAQIDLTDKSIRLGVVLKNRLSGSESEDEIGRASCRERV